jgi:phytanoyl-CoA hydroxylase
VDRHPWNTAFEWRDHIPPFRRVTPDQARQFDHDGFFVLEDAFEADTVRAVRAEIDGYEAELEEKLRRRDNGRILIAEADAITFTTHLVTRSRLLRDFAAGVTFADLCVDLVGPDANLYWDQAVYKKPEKPRRFPWHQDNGYTFVEPQQYLTCWVALTDATVENGCPHVAPELHRLGTLQHTYIDPLGYECFADPGDVVAAPVRAGGMVVFSSLTPHFTGPNTTTEVRKAYIVQYAPVGARIQHGDPATGPPTSDVTADDPDRQFAVARDGARVT